MINILIIGYYAMSNFGSEMRLRVIIEDLKKIKKDVKIKVVSLLNFKEEHFPGITFVRLKSTSVFNPIKLIPYIMKADIVINGEGIPFVDFCGVGFLAYFLPTLYIANKLGKKTICYSFDIDHLTKIDNRLTINVLKNTDLLIVRTPDSAKHLKKMNINKKVFVTADPALLYKNKKIIPEFGKSDKLRIGIVLKDFFCYPIVIKLFGKKEDVYNYPYFYSYEKNGKERLAKFKKQFIHYINFLKKKYSAEIYFLVLDHMMDYKVNESIYNEIGDDVNVHLVSFNNHTIMEIAGLLSTFDFLVSSRLHGLIAALQYGIPMVGLESDERFKYFFDYIEMPEYCIDYRKSKGITKLHKVTKKAIANSNRISKKLKIKYGLLSKKAMQNRKIIKDFFKLHY